VIQTGTVTEILDPVLISPTGENSKDAQECSGSQRNSDSDGVNKMNIEFYSWKPSGETVDSTAVLRPRPTQLLQGSNL